MQHYQFNTIEGKVSLLEIVEGKENLLTGMQKKAAIAGAGAALAGQAGIAANAAMLALYDGEDVKHFGCLVNDQLIIGTFNYVSFAEGDDVRVITTKENNTNFAHAVIRLSDQRVWLPNTLSQGRNEALKNSLGVVGIFMIISFMLVVGVNLIQSGPAELILKVLMPCAIFLWFLLSGLLYKSSRPDALYAEQIFKELGFKNPKNVSLVPFIEKDRESPPYKGKFANGYNLRNALEKLN
jgi:hypothetical protein